MRFWGNKHHKTLVFSESTGSTSEILLFDREIHFLILKINFNSQINNKLQFFKL